jgi:hypothetical protein
MEPKRGLNATATENKRAALEQKCIALSDAAAVGGRRSDRAVKHGNSPLTPVHEASQPKKTERGEARRDGLRGRRCAADATIVARSA